MAVVQLEVVENPREQRKNKITPSNSKRPAKEIGLLLSFAFGWRHQYGRFNQSKRKTRFWNSLSGEQPKFQIKRLYPRFSLVARVEFIYKNLRHAEHRLQAGEYKKMSHAIANK